MPSGWDDDRHLPVRYLQLFGGSYEKTYAEIVRLDKDYRERRVNLPAKLPEYIDELQKGFLYAYGRDKSMRPIVVLDVRRMLDSGVDPARLGLLADMLTNYLYFLGLKEGAIEGWTVLVDFKVVSLWELPVMAIANMLIENANCFRGSMMKSVAVHVHPLIVAGKNLVFKFLNEMQTSKINFIGDQDPALLDEVFGLANLEWKYGGQLPD